MDAQFLPMLAMQITQINGKLEQQSKELAELKLVMVEVNNLLKAAHNNGPATKTTVESDGKKVKELTKPERIGKLLIGHLTTTEGMSYADRVAALKVFCRDAFTEDEKFNKFWSDAGYLMSESSNNIFTTYKNVGSSKSTASNPFSQFRSNMANSAYIRPGDLPRLKAFEEKHSTAAPEEPTSNTPVVIPTPAASTPAAVNAAAISLASLDLGKDSMFNFSQLQKKN